MKPATILLFCLPMVAPKAIPNPNSEELHDSALSIRQAKDNPVELHARWGWMPSAFCAACMAYCLRTSAGVVDFQFKVTSLHFEQAANFALCGATCVLDSQCFDSWEHNGIQYPKEPAAMWNWMKANGYVLGMGSSSPVFGSQFWAPDGAGYAGSPGSPS